MNNLRNLFVYSFSSLFALLLSASAIGEEKIILTPSEANFGDDSEPEISEHFADSDSTKSWKATRGKWTAIDGKLQGVEVAADKHAAVGTYSMPHSNAAVRFTFQLAGSKGFHLSFNHPKGHLFRIMVSETQALLRTDKDKKDPASKIVNLDSKKAKFEQGKTYTILCETVGDKVTVRFDNGVSLKGQHELLKKKKTGYRLIVKGEGVLFDDFTVWPGDEK